MHVYKGNQPWIFFGRTDAEAPILWSILSDAKSQLIRKDPDAGKDQGQEEKGTTEDEMAGWDHWFWHEFEQSLGNSEGQGSLVCCSSWGHKELDTTERLNNNSSKKEGKKSTINTNFLYFYLLLFRFMYVYCLPVCFIFLQNSNQTCHLHLKFKI